MAQAQEDTKQAAIYKRWMDDITSTQKVFKDYEDRCKKILKVYKDERKASDNWDAWDADRRGSHKLNILWSNIQTLQPALYSQTPEPNVSRRFLDRDPVSRTAAMIVERNLATAQELCEFDYVMKRVRDDYLLCARGIDWVRFAPEIGKAPVREPVTKIDMGESGVVYRPTSGGDQLDPNQVKEDEEGLYYETDPEEQILAYGLALDHVVWNDFLHDPVNDWAKVSWGAKRVLLKRPQLIKEFGEEIGRKIKLNKTFAGKKSDENSSDISKKPDCAEVWEIWDKARREVVWISDGYENAIIKQQPDPLKLTGFFPFPRPIFGTTTTDNCIPVPDYCLYQDQAQQIDTITDRIRLLIQALRVVGLYNGESQDLSRLLGEAGENEMIPVANWMAFAQSGGMKTNIDWLPIEQIQNVLTGLFNARAQLKQDLYEVTGISDIIRGATAPSETATAQQIKANFGNLRLQDRQAEMARFARDTLRIMAEIQCEHYDPEALVEMSGMTEMDEFRIEPPDQNDPQQVMAYQQALLRRNQHFADAIKLIKSDRLRTFKVDIETDATVAPDQEQEKKARVEFLTAVAPFIEKATQLGMMAPQMVPLLMKMLDFGVRGFRAGRTLEGAIEEAISTAEKMQKMAEQNPQQPPPDPKAEAEAQKLQGELQMLQAKLQAMQAEAQVAQQKAQADLMASQAENNAKAAEMQKRALEAEQKFQAEMQKINEEIEFRRVENQKRMIDLNHSIKLKELQIEAELSKAYQAGMPQEQPEKGDTEVARENVDLAKSQVELAKMKAEYAGLVQKLQGFDGIEEALQSVGFDPTTAPIVPKKKKPLKKIVKVERHPSGGFIGSVEEVDDETPDSAQVA